MITVTAAIIVRNQKVLAARRAPGKDLAGFWEFPGGKLEPGESPEDCLQRELAEELGITVAIGPLIAENEHHYNDKAIRLRAYRVDYVGNDFTSSDHDALKWCGFAELRALNWAPADIPIVDAFLQGADAASNG